MTAPYRAIHSVPYDGPTDECVTVKCVECGDLLEAERRHMLDPEGGDWKIERGEHGEIVATCGGCRETDLGDGSGERDA